jgi:hypothetical protein
LPIPGPHKFGQKKKQWTHVLNKKNLLFFKNILQGIIRLPEALDIGVNWMTQYIFNIFWMTYNRFMSFDDKEGYEHP